MNDKSIDTAANELVTSIAKTLNLVRLDYFIKQRTDGPYLVLQVVAPSEHIFSALRAAQSQLPKNHLFKERATLQKRVGQTNDKIQLPETHLLRTVLSSSLTVDQHTFGMDFFDRYIPSVFGHEEQLVSEGNFLVYGRRGSGKSSLLAYAMHHCREQRKPFAWIAMQPYAGRDDVQVSIDIVSSILRQLNIFLEGANTLSKYQHLLDDMVSMDDIEAEKRFLRLLPRISQVIADVTKKSGEISIFLDDIHVLSQSFQPKVLGHLYSISRGNRCHLKVSGIERFTRPWSTADQIGLESPHDAQVLKLDYNLTMPDKSKTHIVNILDSHARFCGLPSVAYVSGTDVLSRLVWVAAAVPRDALHLFAQAITRAASHGQKAVTITSINLAASEIAEHKLQDVEQERSQEFASTRAMLDQLKTFCIKVKRQNAFLLEIKNNDASFRCVQDLIALRLVHVLHEGITPHEAGRRYQALMLDYGFYVGIRAARSVDLFQKHPKTPSAQELRKLPVFQANL